MFILTYAFLLEFLEVLFKTQAIPTSIDFMFGVI